MSEMFRPPAVGPTAIGWRQVCGFAQRDDAFWTRVRTAQLSYLNRYVPFNLGLLCVNCITLGITLRGIGDAVVVLGWAAVILALAVSWYARWVKWQLSAGERVVTRREFWQVGAELALLGIGFGGLILHLMPLATPDQQMILVTVALVAIVAAASATVVMPLASMVMSGAVTLATLAGVPATAPLAGWPLVVALVSLLLLIGRITVVTTFTMMARMRAQARSTEQSEVIGLLLSEFEANGSDWLLEVDREGCLTHVSARFAEVAGRTRGAMLGQPLLTLLGDDRRGPEARAAVRELRQRFERREPFRGLVVPVVQGDTTRWWQLSGTPKYDAAGDFTGYRGVGSDITEMRVSNDRIAHLARFDPLTGLANRGLVRETIADALARAVRTGKPCALMFVDLDRFKTVNDTLGHLAGDRLLREVAGRLREALGGHVHIGRLGGDEFAIVLPDASTRRAEALSRTVVAALTRPFSIDDQSVTIGASVGFAMGPADGATVDRLLRSADLALYEVKGSGRGHACRFVPEIQQKADERRALEADLRGALDRGELALAFQPVVEAADEQIVGFEALLRWNHPVRGVISPLKFVPIAEETGLINPIGAWVIAEACRAAAQWPPAIRIAVNLSPIQFDDRRLAHIVRDALAAHRIAPERLELEITESLFLNEKAATIAMLAELKAIGIRFALDDFGTGYSSLGYLHKVAFSRIKIDRSFVERATAAGGESVAIIQAIVSLAASLGMTTTAEGTETRAEFEAIRALGCNQVQGYLFGRPMSPDAATALVTERAAA